MPREYEMRRKKREQEIKTTNEEMEKGETDEKNNIRKLHKINIF